MKSKLLFTALLLTAVPGFGAGLSFVTATPWVQTGVAGAGPVIFAGSLVDSDAAAPDPQNDPFLFLNDISIVADSPLSLDPSPPGGPDLFFTNTVIGFLVGDGNADPFYDTYTGPIFEVFIAPGTAAGSYFGILTILGGNSPDDITPLASRGFEVDVVTPEPGVFALMLGGLAGISVATRRRSRQAARRVAFL